MATPLNSLSSYLLFSFLLSHVPLPSASRQSPQCLTFNPSGCSDILSLSFPFTYSSDPTCGLFHVECGNGSRNQFEAGGRRYNIKGVLPEDSVIIIQDDEIARRLQNNFCNYLQNLTLPNSDFASFQLVSHNFTFLECNDSPRNIFKHYSGNIYNYTGCDSSVIYYWREEQPNLTAPFYHANCSLFTYPISEWLAGPSGLKDLRALLSSGFLLRWHLTTECIDCHFSKNGICDWNRTAGKFICSNAGENGENGHSDVRKIATAVSSVAGAVIVLISIFLIFFFREGIQEAIFFWNKEHKDDRDVEKFLKNYGSVVPKRYHYSDLKKMTNSFEAKLGQGAFGGVFKGKLQDGRLVAVKVLSNSKCNGEDFVNEVASIGRTNHVNIVSLLGFCSNRSKRALIYEFMHNGSLEQFIHGKARGTNPLGWEKLYEIAIGIARGLDYLHRGCCPRIVHLDIKPHNILLDKDFRPKISDFGLAKICPPKESIISMLGPRGTVGYIAPEVFCRNFGGVSHKSDVYSYGMMVLEMVGGRSNIEATAEKTSEIYFPDWIYERVELNEHLELHGVTTREEEDIARKMIMMALWCIQVDPADRPTTGRVVEMLEGSIESLPVPPPPFLYSPSGARQLHSPVSTS